MLKSGMYTQLAPVLFGSGTAGQAGEIVKSFGCSKVMLVSDEGVLEAGAAGKVRRVLERSGIEVVMWAEAETDCPEESVKRAAAVGRREKIDGVVGVGGGSVLDTAKAVSAVVPNDDQVLDDIVLYLTGQKEYANAPVPVIEIPTTAGTGSESTFVAVVTSDKLDCKIGLPVPPSYGIVDSELMKTVPPYITAFTGMDALSHASEALTEQKNTPHSDLLACEAIRLIKENLPAAVKDAADMEARDRLAFASSIAGISFNESGVHIGHSAAHALGHLYHIPHGVCCANLTPAVIRFAAKTYPQKMKRLGELMGAAITSDDPEVIGKEAADAVRSFARAVGIKSFKELGLTKEQMMAAKPMFYGDALCMAFGGEVTEQDAADILADAYEG
ncbi:alcohol dehydrogenase, iron-dependent [[Clostridium] hylemonae DSM 15053]|uniref:Alcohol dehydrogenase, iron-dependent n=1 Tax=[Clostridium] hylemonae DSM 15053 TaxID=553973 RepID=C0BXM4_9FIRM|nr:iron-containing alcohol dehydrogenase [[Clostridium] hylemonae]EEG75331.1 alcohol dehydrogenase, iron-dependent [[Clostridium] hylemonae DSM 15053]QEK17045.1 NAD-dependent methanol dehydrogenase [[Clostridium] hylemonae DSM 15053]